MKSFSHFQLWLARVTSSTFLSKKAMHGKIQDIKTVYDLIHKTTLWNPGATNHNTEAAHIVRVELRRLMLRDDFGLVDADSRVQFWYPKCDSEIGAYVWPISVCDNQNNTAEIPYSVLANYRDHQLYIVDNTLIFGPTGV